MKAFLSQYRYECTVAVVCCIILVAYSTPTIVDRLGKAWGWNDAVVVYHKRIGRPLMEGDSYRDAVETRLREIRTALSSHPGLVVDGVVVDDAEEKIGRLSDRQRSKLGTLYRSLYAADLENADLQDVDFRGMNLTHVDFCGANLSGARFEGARLEGAQFTGANLTKASFGPRPPDVPMAAWPAGGDANGARFDGCVFEDQMLSGRLHGASFRDANLRGATMRLLDGEGVDISGANLEGGSIEVFPDTASNVVTASAPVSFYASLNYDEGTNVNGLRLAGVSDPSISFVSWALARGAVLAELPTVSPESFALEIPRLGPSRDTSPPRDQAGQRQHVRQETKVHLTGSCACA